MTSDTTLLALVRSTAKRFTECHREELAQLESVGIGPACDGYSRELLEEVERLGWLEGSSAGDEDPPFDESALLTCLVSELGRHAPALACRLLSHHWSRICLQSARDALGTKVASVSGGWLAFDVSLGDTRLAPAIELHGSAPDATLNGEMRFVLAGDVASEWLALAQAPSSEFELVLVPRGSVSRIAPVQTLGLAGSGVCTGELHHVAAPNFESLGRGSRANAAIQSAYRAVAPAVLGLAIEMTAQARRIAAEHASIRRQHGQLLQEIPAVRGMLMQIDRALASLRLTQVACRDRVEDGELLFAEAMHAARGATDVALQVLGGSGYMVGYGVEKLWRDMRQLSQFLPRPA